MSKASYRSFLVLLASALSLNACSAVNNALVGIGGAPSTTNVKQPAPITSDSKLQKGPDEEAPIALKFPAEHPVPFTAKDRQYIGAWNGSSYTDQYLKGVNLGIGLPGTRAGDLAATREMYAQWFQQMVDMGFNNVRVYTLHYPRFYEELAKFNAQRPDDPLYVFHGIWLDEVEFSQSESHDLYESTESFQQEIRDLVNAIHGNLEMPQRRGKAYGSYKTDISRWVMGWIIGREIAPEEVIPTNEAHPNNTRYEGKHLNLSGNPTEVWMAEQIDHLVDYERSQYKVDRPISMSSWPTLDPLFHETESPINTSEDVVGVDLGQIEMFDMPGGYFPSFHAYPYYPNFMNNEPEYTQESDAQGTNNYIGYLKELKNHYKHMPLVIGEYGVPSSWGNAHFSPSGMHHGGHDEKTQMRYNARMSQNIYDEGLAGGMVFAWIDEWWKRTWIVDEREMPRERFRLWHNLTSPEENFGMIAFEPEKPNYTLLAEGDGLIQRAEAAANPDFFHVKLTLDRPLKQSDELIIGYDTYRDDLGEVILPNTVKTNNRNEFALKIEGTQSAQLHVTQAYDLVGIWHYSSGPEQIYRSQATSGAPWQLARWQNGQEHRSRDGSMIFPLTHFDIGQLQVRQNTPSSKDAVLINGNELEIRLPWSLLHFTDPTTLSVTHDDRDTPIRETAQSEGIALSVSLGNELIETGRYRWNSWNSAPPTKERIKEGVSVFTQTLEQLPDTL